MLPKNIYAQVYINEFSSYESTGDWVELYATVDTDISGFVLRDTSVSKMKTIPQGTTIGPSTSQFYIIDVGNRLNRDSDKIELRQSDDSTVVDQVWYGDSHEVCAPETGQSAGKSPDGTGTWVRFSGQTKNAANTQSTSPCSNNNTPEPTKSPAPTPSPTPKPTVVPTPSQTQPATAGPQIQAATTTNSISSNTTPTPLPQLGNERDSDTKIIHAETAQNLSEDSQEAKSPPFIAYTLVLAGVSSIGAGIYPFAKKWMKGYNNHHDPPPPPTFYS